MRDKHTNHRRLIAAVRRASLPSKSANPLSAIFHGLRGTIAPYIIEFVGTYLLCFTATTAASPSNGSTFVPMSIGGMLMALQVYSGGST